MKLTIGERIIITTQLLPVQGKMTDMIIARDILDKTGLKQEDIVENNIQEIKGSDGKDQLTWKESGKIFEVEFTEIEREILSKGVALLDEKGLITLPIVLLIRKINDEK